MTLTDLAEAIRTHAGTFECRQIHGDQRRSVAFRHITTAPVDIDALPDIGRLREFYGLFGSVAFYADERSGDAARWLAPPDEWAGLDEAFRGWLFDDEDLEDWVENCLVIGETPHSGNYILLATDGDAAGRVFEFDHDGFEFREAGADVVDYATAMLRPDDARLTDFASHMRFIEGDGHEQWWIETMHDNRGHAAVTHD